MKKKVLILIFISLLFISLNVSAQSSLLFDKDQFQSKFNQKTPSLNTEAQGEFGETMQNQRQQAMKSSQEMPDMSMGRGFTQGLQAPGMDKIDGGMFEGFHFKEENITPDNFKGDFSATFANQQRQNMEYGQNGMNKAQSFDNSIPKEELQNKFSDLRSNNNNSFIDFEKENRGDMSEGLDEFEDSFASFEDKRNTDMGNMQEEYNQKHNSTKTEIEKPSIFETGEFKEAPTIENAQHSGNPYVGGGSRSSEIEIGRDPDSPLFSHIKNIGDKADNMTSGLRSIFGFEKNTDTGQDQSNIKSETKKKIQSQFPALYRHLDNGVGEIKDKVN